MNKNQNKQYVKPIAEVVIFTNDDVIRTSPAAEREDEEVP